MGLVCVCVVIFNLTNAYVNFSYIATNFPYKYLIFTSNTKSNKKLLNSALAYTHTGDDWRQLEY